jgi:hypothetical protein
MTNSQDKECNNKEPHSHLVHGRTFECEKGVVSQDKTNWEIRERLNFNFNGIDGAIRVTIDKKEIKSIVELYEYIESLLTEKEEEIVQKLDGIDKTAHICRFNDGDCKCDCYYQSLQDAIDIIKGK